MLSGKLKKQFVAALVCLLLFSIVSPVTADQADSEIPIHPINAVGTVYIDGHSYFKMKNAHLVPTDNGKTAVFTISLVNRSSTDIMFINYWLKLTSDGGSNYSPELIPADKDKNRVSANSTQDFTFLTKVGDDVKISDLNLQMIKWDFSQPNYEKVLGNIKIPADYSTTIPVDSAGIIELQSTNLKGYVKRVSINQTEKHHKPTVELVLQNIGSKSTNLDGFDFFIRTDEGLDYPVTSNQLEGLSLQPKAEEEIKLKAEIPASVNIDSWKLVVSHAASEMNGQVPLPVGQFELPEASTQPGGAVGQEYSFTNDDGEYFVELNSISRLPLDNEDIVSANVVLTNKSNDTLPIPNLAGKFTLDDAVDKQAELIISDKMIGLKSGDSIQLKFYSTIPYTYDFSKIQLVLQEKESSEGNASLSDLLEFEHTDDLMQIPLIQSGESHEYASIGNRSTFSVREINNYEGKSQNVYSIQMLIRNDEKRLNKLINMVPNLKLSDGTIYPMEQTEIKSQIRPNGHALVHMWTYLPKDTDVNNAQLLLGEAVVSAGESGTTLDAYINPVSYVLPKEETKLTDSLVGLDFYPFTLSLSKISSQIIYGEDKLEIKFDYNLEKDSLVESNLANQKVIIEIEDPGANVSFTKTYSFEGNSSEENSGSDYMFELGSHDGKFEVQDRELVFKLETLQHFNFRVFYEFEPGHKKLIADKRIRWFSTTD